MPLDKQSNGHAAKPFTPSLSSHFRSTKTPLTPKLIGSAQSSPALSPRREIYTRAPPSGKEESLASPLNVNITPRSGTRNSRIGTESPATPGGSKANTTNRPRAVSINEGPRRTSGNGVYSLGLGISSHGATSTAISAMARPKSTALDAQSPIMAGTKQNIRSTKVGLDRDVSPQFFRAGQVKPKPDSKEVNGRPKLGPKAATTFFFASSANSSSISAEPARANSLGTAKAEDGKFFHANDAPAPLSQHPPPRPVFPKRNSSKSTTSPRILPSDPQPRSQSKSRAQSPLKDSPLRTGPTQPISPWRQANKNTTASSDARAHLDRRKSIGSNMSAKFQPGHKKSASTTSFHLNLTPTPTTDSPKIVTPPRPDLHIPSRAIASHDTSQTTRFPQFPVSPDSPSPRSTSLTSSHTMATSDTNTDHSELIRLQSPIDIKSPTTSLPQTQPQHQSTATPDTQQLQPTLVQKQAELAAAARRERKVLDLEISNSSLLAINKTLEREMRKQSAELRRFRRLSRSGRLSIATAGSLRAASRTSGLSTLSEDPEDGDDLDPDDILDGLNDLDLSSEEEDDDADLESTLSTSSSQPPNANSNPLSPTSRSARRRRRDEKRLLLDLSKHQQLLLDSQKLSQSIRRCCGWAEEMIRDGEKALAYRVGIGDVSVGGRVLHHDEEEEEDENEKMEVIMLGDDCNVHDSGSVETDRIGDGPVLLPNR